MGSDVTFREARELKKDSLTLEMIERAESIVEVSRLRPLNDRVLIRRVNVDNKKTVKIADAYAPGSNRGEVLAVGPDVHSLQKGDQVIFSNYGAQDLSNELPEIDDKLVLVSVHDIWLRL